MCCMLYACVVYAALSLCTPPLHALALQYAYNIRYNYGKEGKRADFSPYSCVKIITAPAPTGDEAHGE